MTPNKIFFIRHATPDWDRRDIPYHLPPGPPLTSQGMAEAHALGNFLQPYKISHVYSSPLERCRHTAAISSGVAGSTYQIDDRITEWQPDEDQEAVQQRLKGFLEAVCSEHLHFRDASNGLCLLVSHGGPIAMFLLLLGLDPKVLSSHRVYDHGNPLPPGGVWQAAREDGESPWQFDLVFIPQVKLA